MKNLSLTSIGIILGLAMALPITALALSVSTVPQGGTGWANIQTGTIPYGNNTSPLSTSSNLTFNGTTLTTSVIAANSTTGTSTVTNALQIGSTAGDHALTVVASRTYPISISTGGMVNLTNTSNDASALTVSTNHAGSATARLVEFNCSNASFNQDCQHIDYSGTGDGLSVSAGAASSNAFSITSSGVDHTANIAYTGSTAAKGGLNVTSTNTAGSPLQISGNPAGLGVVKASVNASGFNSSTSVFSGDASVANYTGQGLFLDSTGGGWVGKILNLRANGTEYLTLLTTGNLGISSSTPSAKLSVQANPTDATINSTLFAIGSSTPASTTTLFSVSSGGHVATCESKIATSSTINLDWTQTCPEALVQIGGSAITINLLNATTTTEVGSRKLITICNPTGTAGAVTWNGAEWFGGTTPTQTTTANQCDAWSFYVTQGTSTTATYKVFGAMSAGAQ